MGFLGLALSMLLLAAWLAILGRVIASWLDPRFERPPSRLLYAITEPVLAPVRRALPRTGMLDLSPLVVLVVLGIVIRLLGR
jgi:YggT family protein